MKRDGRILGSLLITPDGTVLVSHHVHDYVVHEDANGKTYMLDGGLDYIRSTVHADQRVVTIVDHDAFEDIRLVFCRGGRGKDGRQPLKWVPICDMSDNWLSACIDYCYDNNVTKYVDIYEEEQRYRKENGIIVPE